MFILWYILFILLTILLLPVLKNNKKKKEKYTGSITVKSLELGGGSIRIHDRTLQSQMFDLLGFSKEESQAQFGFLMNAFEYGAPPHGGLAFGLDRLVATMGGSESIRDYIAFPKNNSGRDTMIDAPSPLNEIQMKELGIKLR